MPPGTVPDVVFHTRVRNDALGGPNPFEWKQLMTADVFGGRNVVLFALPGAFTLFFDTHLPGDENSFEEFRRLGVDSVVCLAVNHAFIMFQWAKSRNIEKVVMLPDGNGDFTRLMGTLVARTVVGMELRSWRYSIYVEDRAIRNIFAEPGLRDNAPGVPVQVSGAGTMLKWLGSR